MSKRDDISKRIDQEELVRRFPRLAGMAVAWRHKCAEDKLDIRDVPLAELEADIQAALDSARKLRDAESEELIVSLLSIIEQAEELARIRAYFVGAEQGKRVGADVAKQFVQESRNFGTASAQHLLRLAGWDEEDFSDSYDTLEPEDA